MSAAIRRFDGKGCRAALATLTSVPATDIRVQSATAICTMVAGDCDDGTRQLSNVNARQGSSNAGLAVMADLYCPLTSDPETRLRRLSRRLDMFHDLDCAMYLRPLRESARIAESEHDRRLVGSLLNTVAKCFSFRGKCDQARDILGEAQVFIPALALDELAPACR